MSEIVWTPHPVLPVPSREQLSALVAGLPAAEALARVREVHSKREEVIQREKLDPLRYGYEPASWKRTRELLERYDKVFISGGNREGKSTFVAKYAVQDLVEHPGRCWFFFHSSERSSIDQQQVLVHGMLPPEWRELGKAGTETYVKYARATGFSNFKFILPNGSMGLFFNYGQDIADFEGYEIDGAWFDELVPLSFIQAMRYRLGRGRRTRIIVTFTPVHGYNAVVGEFLKGARVLESRRAEAFAADRRLVEGCAPGHMPYVMESAGGREAAIFHHNGMNPYGAGAKVAAEAASDSDEQKKIRLYGWADKPAGAALTKFTEAHLIARAKFEELAKRGGTRYCVCDPAGVKNWFIKWYFVTPAGKVVVYREWPDRRRFGDWAEQPPDGAKGVNRYNWLPGPAQVRESVNGIIGYKRLILELEGWVWDEGKKAWDGAKAEKIQARLIDPRGGGTDSLVADDSLTIAELLEREDRDQRGTVLAPSMFFDPAPGGGRVHLDMQLLNDWLDYDTTQPLSLLNEPRWFVVEDLEQTIVAYREFTALGSDKDALKDIIDPDRYFVKADLGHVEERALRVSGGGYY